MVRAKFEVRSVETYDEGSAIELDAVYDENPESENGKFFKYTPGGQITLEVVSPETAKLFVPGKEYYVDFTPAGE